MEDLHFQAAEHARHTSIVPPALISGASFVPPAEAGGYRSAAATRLHELNSGVAAARPVSQEELEPPRPRDLSETVL